MKFILALFLLFSHLLVGNLSYARKDMVDYWKNKMNGQPMPEAIKNLIQVSQQASSDAGKAHNFIRDFDVHPNIILYHTHVVQPMKQQKAFDQNFEPAVSSNRKSLLNKPSKKVEPAARINN